MNIYLIIYFILVFLGMGVSMSEHGMPKKGYNNFWITFIAFLIQMGLFYMAGIFDLLIK